MGTNHGGGTPIKITDEQLREACKTMTRLEIAEAFGMHPESVSRRMKRAGCYGLKVKNGESVWAESLKKARASSKRRQPKGWHYVAWADNVVQEKHPAFDFVAYFNGRIRLQCKECGAEIERAQSTVKQKGIRCEGCREAKQMDGLRRQLVNTLNRIIASKTTKTCPVCGKEFCSPYPDAVYCSQGCKRKHRGSSVRRRCRKYRVPYHTGITLPKVYRRDGGICQICGKPTDWNDKAWGEHLGPMHPTIDHIVALASGGGHTWDNVQLAHAICNSYKRDT